VLCVAGCKIKALRAKTNTYIKTPVRGEEPVFVVTGRKEDVGKAKREILSAAEHFSQIRASRKNNMNGLGSAGSLSPPGPPSHVPGQVTIQVRVPYRVVGLVVGPKGATIKRIQHQTSTYIVTPSRDKEPVFEVTGLPSSVETARREIEAHIAVRTGAPRGMDLMEESDVLASLCGGPGFNTLMHYLDNGSSQEVSAAFNALTSSTGSSGAFSSAGSCSSSSSDSSGRLGDLVNIWNTGGAERERERDEGLGDSPSFEGPLASANNIWAFHGGAAPSTIPLGNDAVARPSPSHSASPTESLTSLGSLGGILGRNTPTKRDCMMCSEKEVVAALVPCGHNLFCMECANQLCESSDPTCPSCQQTVAQAIRIRS